MGVKQPTPDILLPPNDRTAMEPLLPPRVIKQFRAILALAVIFWAAGVSVALWVLVTHWPQDRGLLIVYTSIIFAVGLAILGSWFFTRRMELTAARSTHLDAESRAQRDSLTGLLNHGAFARLMELEVLLPESSGKECLGFAYRLLALTATKPLPEIGGRDPNFKISFSIGLASLPEDGDTPADLLGKADQAAYTAKGRGGSRVVQPSDL